MQISRTKITNSYAREISQTGRSISRQDEKHENDGLKLQSHIYCPNFYV